jgi:hypothetical protein
VFTATGFLWIEPSQDLRRRGKSAAIAEGRLMLDGVAAKIAGRHPPQRLSQVQEELGVAVAGWMGCTHQRIKARLQLALTTQDKDRVQFFEDALRDQELRTLVERKRLTEVRDLLMDPELARAWWLSRRSDELSDLSWSEFNELLPKTSGQPTELAESERVSEIVSAVVARLADAPEKQELFLATSRTVLQQMGWDDLIRESHPSTD